MNTPEITVKRREGTGKGVARRLRRAGAVPAILYGGATPQTITVNPRDVLRIIHGHEGTTQLLSLKVEGDGRGSRAHAGGCRGRHAGGAGGPHRAQAQGRGRAGRGRRQEGPRGRRREEARGPEEGREGKVSRRRRVGPCGGGAREPGTGVPGHPPQHRSARRRSSCAAAEEGLAPRRPRARGARLLARRCPLSREAAVVHERERTE